MCAIDVIYKKKKKKKASLLTTLPPAPTVGAVA